MVSFLSPNVDAVSFTIGPEEDGAREVTVSLMLDGDPVAAGVIVPVYLSDDPAGIGLSALGEITGGSVPVYCSHYQTDASGEFSIRVSYTAPGDPFYLVVVLPSGELVVSDPLEFTT